MLILFFVIYRQRFLKFLNHYCGCTQNSLIVSRGHVIWSRAGDFKFCDNILLNILRYPKPAKRVVKEKRNGFCKYNSKLTLDLISLVPPKLCDLPRSCMSFPYALYWPRLFLCHCFKVIFYHTCLLLIRWYCDKKVKV